MKGSRNTVGKILNHYLMVLHVKHIENIFNLVCADLIFVCSFPSTVPLMAVNIVVIVYELLLG